jgi:hypothetical protein
MDYFGNLTSPGPVIDACPTLNLSGATLRDLLWQGTLAAYSGVLYDESATVHRLDGSQGTIVLGNATLAVEGGTLDNVTLRVTDSMAIIRNLPVTICCSRTANRRRVTATTANRWLFQNARAGWNFLPKPPRAPVLTGGPVVDAARRRLLDRTGPRRGATLTEVDDLHLLADGVRVDPHPRPGGIFLFRLPQPASDVRIFSRSAVLAQVGLARDARCGSAPDHALARCPDAPYRRGGYVACRRLPSVRARQRFSLDRWRRSSSRGPDR